jgi:hypothetical protein
MDIPMTPEEYAKMENKAARDTWRLGDRCTDGRKRILSVNEIEPKPRKRESVIGWENYYSIPKSFVPVKDDFLPTRTSFKKIL